jgi:hypothetical protein
MTPIYEISASVADALTACVTNEVFTFAVIEPSRNDSLERRKKLQKEWDEISDLIQMDLLKDVSYKFGDQIRDCRDKHGFQYKVVELTEIAVHLFTDIQHRRVN